MNDKWVREAIGKPALLSIFKTIFKSTFNLNFLEKALEADESYDLLQRKREAGRLSEALLASTVELDTGPECDREVLVEALETLWKSPHVPVSKLFVLFDCLIV